MPDTRQRILDAALDLFNARGSGNVSTRHIAEHLGISPGNLYYHYPNKEAIVRALFDRLDVAAEAGYAFPADEPLALEHVAAMLREAFEIVWRFRFFYREMTLLVHNDPALADRYREMRGRGERDTRFVVACAVDAGLLEPLDDPTRDALVAALLVLSNHWLGYEEMAGRRIEERDLERGVVLLVRLLEPHLTPRARRDLPALARS